MKAVLKSLTGLFVFLFAVTAFSNAQVVNIPEKSKADFESKYPDATDVEWTNALAKYTVKFTKDNESYKSHYYINGSWHYTEKFLDKDDLPKDVIASYEKSRIADWEYVGSAWVENKYNEKAFRIEAKRGIEKKLIYYDEKGKELKSAPSL
jgi:hypothetical protein